MKYNRLGHSGLKVSALSLGSWTTYGGSHDEQTAYDCMTVALKHGVNFFDNAEAYAGGKSETVMGNVFQKWFSEGLCRRSDLVVSTKIFWGFRMAGVKGNPNANGLSRKHIIEGVSDSLKRLQLDYVDLIFCHRPDPQTPIEETVRAMNQVISSGKAFYWGTSEWSAQEITEAHAIASRNGLIGPLMEQPQYNMLHRTRFEVEYAPLYKAFGMGTTIWSPLASGYLTGKYNGGTIPEGSRMSQEFNAWLLKDIEKGEGINGLEVKDVAEVCRRVENLRPIAAKLETTLAVLALAWCLKNDNVSTVITGASRPSQVEENMTALAVAEKLTPDVLAEIEAAIQSKPNPPKDWGRGQLRVAF